MYCQTCGRELSHGTLICPSCSGTNKTGTADNGKKEVGKSTVISAYVAALLLPIIGLVVALYLLIRHQVSHAIGVAATSVVFLSFWYTVFMSGPDASNFAWECEGAGETMLQCQISNAGPGAGSLTFDVVIFCNTGEYRTSVQSGELQAGRAVQRVARFSGMPANTYCDALEYRNEVVR